MSEEDIKTRKLAEAQTDMRERCATWIDSICEVCKGAGYTIEPVCCGRAGEECCGQPDPSQVQCGDWVHGIAANLRLLPLNESATPTKP